MCIRDSLELVTAEAGADAPAHQAEIPPTPGCHPDPRRNPGHGLILTDHLFMGSVCSIGMLEQAEGSATKEGPDLITTVNAMPATHIPGTEQKQHGRDGTAWLAIGPCDLNGAPLHFPVPTAFGMRLQPQARHECVERVHH